MPLVRSTGMTVLRTVGDLDLGDGGRCLVGERQVDLDALVGRTLECGRDGDHEVHGPELRVRLRGLGECRRVRDERDRRLRRRGRGDVRDEAAERRADAAGDHPDPADADVQDEGAEQDDAEDERDLPIDGQPAGTLHGAMAGDPGGTGRPGLDLDRGGAAAGRWAGSDVGCRWSRRVVIAGDCRTECRCTGAEHSAAMVRCVVLWRGRARDDPSSRPPWTEGQSAGSRSARWQANVVVGSGRTAGVRGRPDRPGVVVGDGSRSGWDGVRAALDGRRSDRPSACPISGATSARTST